MKIISSIVLVLALSVGMTGCGSNDKSAAGTGTPPTQSASEQGGAKQQSNQQNNQQSPNGAVTDKQGQAQQPDLMGEIVSVTGNSATIKVVDTSSMKNAPQGNNEKNVPQGNNDKSQSNEKNGSQPPAKNDESKPGDNQPGQMNFKYSGTKTITIPEGAAIIASGRGNAAEQAKTMAAKDLKAGDVLQIWYSDKEKETISKISVMSTPDKAPDSAQVKKQ